MAVDAFDRDQQKKLASGSLLTLDNQIDPTTGTLKLKAIFPNEDNALFPNQFVNARLLVDTQHDAILIPTAAIQRNAQGAFVYVIKPDQTASMHTITVAPPTATRRPCKGLQPGEMIAVKGFDKLQDGAKVAVQNNVQRARMENSLHESVSAIYSAARCDIAVDGGDSARRLRGLSATSRLGAAGSGLPDHPGGDVLSGRKPGSGGLGRDRAARAAIRAGARAEPDDLDELGRQLGHRSAVLAESEY